MYRQSCPLNAKHRNKLNISNAFISSDIGAFFMPKCRKERARMADTLGEQIFRDIVSYTNEVKNKSHKTAAEIQKAMIPRITAASPIRHYSTHTQEVKRIVVHRHPPTIPKATKQVKEDKYQPGYFKKGWVKGNIKTKTGKLYGVRNENMPTVVHLVNFGHDLISHGVGVGIVQGSFIVDKVEAWAEKELDAKLSEFLEKEG